MSELTTPKDTIKDGEVPRDAKVIALVLESLGVEKYEPRVINQLLEFMYRTCIPLLSRVCLFAHPRSQATPRMCCKMPSSILHMREEKKSNWTMSLWLYNPAYLILLHNPPLVRYCSPRLYFHLARSLQDI